MDFTYSNMVNLVQDDEKPLLLEDYIKSIFVQPLSYYRGMTIPQVIDELLKAGTGIVEVSPSSDFDRAYYITARQLANGDMMINVLTYASEMPSANNTRRRPFAYDGSIEWKPGDTVYSTDPVTSKCYGWVCVKAGVPGTWHPFGRLAPWSSSLETLEEIPEATKDQKGRQIISASMSGKPVIWYCAAVPGEDEDTTDYQWMTMDDDIPPYYHSHASINEETGNWEFDRIKDVDVSVDTNEYKLKLPKQFAIIFRAPGNSMLNQQVRIGSTIYTMKFMSGRNMEKGDIIAGMTAIMQIDTQTETLTVMGSSSLKYRDRISPFFLSETEAGFQDIWRITKIGDIVAEADSGSGYMEGLPESASILMKIPSDSVTGQIISIGGDNYTVSFADGAEVQENDLKQGTLLMAFIDFGQKHITLEGTGKSSKTFLATASADTGKWRITKIGGYLMDSTPANLDKFTEPFRIVFSAPSDSIYKQTILVGDKSIPVLGLDQDYLEAGDIREGSRVSIDMDLSGDGEATLPSISSNPIYTIKAIAELKAEDIWNITEMNGEEVTREWKRQAILQFTAPSDSVDLQKIRIFQQDLSIRRFFENEEDTLEKVIPQGMMVSLFISPKDSSALLLPINESTLSVHSATVVTARETGLAYQDRDSLVVTSISGVPIQSLTSCERAFGESFLMEFRLAKELKSRFLHMGDISLELKYSDGTWVHDNGVLKASQVILVLVNVIGAAATILYPAPPVYRVYGSVSSDEDDWVLDQVMSSQKVLWDKAAGKNITRDSTKTFMFTAPSDSVDLQKLVINETPYSLLYMDGFPVHAGDISEDAPVPVFLDTVFSIAYVQSSRSTSVLRGKLAVMSDGRWKLNSVEDRDIDDVILQDVFAFLARIPENSEAEQEIVIQNASYSVLTSNGIRVHKDALSKDTFALFLVDRENQSITVPSGGSSSSVFFAAETVLADERIWQVESVNGQKISSENDFQRVLGSATKFALLIKTPSSSLNSQVVQIANTSYPLKKIDGDYIARHDVPGNSLIIVNFDLSMPYGVITAGGSNTAVTEANIYYQKDELGQSRRIEFNEDQSEIKESFADGSVKITVFNEDGSITEKMTYFDGTMASKDITFNDDGSITETVTGKLSPSKAGSITQFSDDEVLAAFEEAVEHHQTSGVVTSSGPITQFTDSDIEGAVRAALIAIRSGQQTTQPDD